MNMTGEEKVPGRVKCIIVVWIILYSDNGIMIVVMEFYLISRQRGNSVFADTVVGACSLFCLVWFADVYLRIMI